MLGAILVVGNWVEYQNFQAAKILGFWIRPRGGGMLEIIGNGAPNFKCLQTMPRPCPLLGVTTQKIFYEIWWPHSRWRPKFLSGVAKIWGPKVILDPLSDLFIHILGEKDFYDVAPVKIIPTWWNKRVGEDIIAKIIDCFLFLDKLLETPLQMR